MLKRIALLFVALTLCAGAAPVRAGENETFAAARDFISALTNLDAALQRFHDLVKASKITGAEVEPLCAALNPDPTEAEQQAPDPSTSISELLKKNNIARGDAHALCDALGAERAIVEQAKGANLRAAAECKAYRIPACDIANEVVAAQRESRARMENGGQ
ncbi:hypothetical protein RZS28_14780 [Methylocapsa polymorpha]|uniref:Uncharacterized protein n=1 Tax=Methylocapsa polymorpha TaxID=3080828 RepID=A0ABZ0HQK2_9HYPH|nr:hypothetical protein RZS28_14780 [Methylocapsa sp. RX1]